MKPVFFELDVLERYFNDPRYRFDFDDYSGSISIKDEFYESDEFPNKDKVLLQSFGLGYNERKDRVVVVYLRYLNDFTPEHQIYWSTKEIHSECKVVAEYVNNTVYGSWVFSYSLFSAFIEEQKAINDLSQLIGKPNLFRKTFENSRPKEFTFFLNPTLSNFEKFVSLLDKMVSDNINKSFFKDDLELTEKIKSDKGEVEIVNKGTLRLLEEWLKAKYTLVNEEGYDMLMKPLKEIRKLRQSPAHRIQEDIYSNKYFEKQMDIMERVYQSLNGFRIILSKHPKAKGYRIKKWLEEGKIKKF